MTQRLNKIKTNNIRGPNLKLVTNEPEVQKKINTIIRIKFNVYNDFTWHREFCFFTSCPSWYIRVSFVFLERHSFFSVTVLSSFIHHFSISSLKQNSLSLPGTLLLSVSSFNFQLRASNISCSALLSSIFLSLNKQSILLQSCLDCLRLRKVKGEKGS